MPTIRMTLTETARRTANLLCRRTGDFECFHPCDLRHIHASPTRTDGYWASLGELDGGGTAALFLDRFPGHAEPRFWFGFDLPSNRHLRKLASIAQDAGFTRSPLVRTGRDLVKEHSCIRYRDPLEHEEFDRLIREHLINAFYLGIYYPRPWPLSQSALRDISNQAANFVTGFSCALDARSNGAAVSRWGRPNDEVEKAAVRFARSWLTTKKYRVQSREAELCGYDLLATHGDRELHVEVKGSAWGERFYLTRNEWTTARRDPLWQLFLVTAALTNPRMRRYSRAEIAGQFSFEATHWYVKREGASR